MREAADQGAERQAHWAGLAEPRLASPMATAKPFERSLHLPWRLSWPAMADEGVRRINDEIEFGWSRKL